MTCPECGVEPTGDVSMQYLSIYSVCYQCDLNGYSDPDTVEDRLEEVLDSL